MVPLGAPQRSGLTGLEVAQALAMILGPGERQPTLGRAL